MKVESGTVLRSIASQREASFSANIINSSTYGESNLGFYGNSGSLNLFKFKFGKIFDLNGKHVWGYNPNQNIFISGNFGKNYINYFINNTPVCLYSPIDSSTLYEYIYFTASGVSSDVNFDIYGDNPDYSFSFASGTGQYLSTDKIQILMNNLSPDSGDNFKIFSGEIFSSNINYYLETLETSTKITSINPALISITGDPIPYVTGDTQNTLNITLYTNFGEITTGLNLNILKAPIYYTELVTGFTGILGTEIDPPFTYEYNYELRSVYPTDRNFTFTLQHVSGYTGLISGLVEVTGKSLTNISGFIYGEEYVTGYKEITGEYTDLQGVFRTGIVKSFVRQRLLPTGNINYIYSLPAISTNLYLYSPPNNNVVGTGIFTSTVPKEEVFLYGQTLGSIEYSGYANLNATYKDYVNYRPQIFSTGSGIGFYTGYIAIDDSSTLWSSTCVTGNGFTGSASKIFVDGNDYYIDYSSESNFFFNSGIISNNYFLSKSFIYGDSLSDIIDKKLLQIGISGNISSIFSSETGSDLVNAFLPSSYFYINNPTGEIGLSFFNQDTIVTHYGFNIDPDSRLYPYIFNFEGSNDKTSWSILDQRTGVSFYPSGRKWFKCKNTGSYQFYRLKINSGILWPHIKYLKNEVLSGLSLYGIKDIDLYNHIKIGICQDDSLITRQVVYTGVSGYDVNALSVDEFSIPGSILYSQDRSEYNAWKAFNVDKTKNPYAVVEMESTGGKEYIGFNATGGYGILNGNEFYLEFVADSSPEYVAICQVNPLTNSEVVLKQVVFPSDGIFSGTIPNSTRDTLYYKFNKHGYGNPLFTNPILRPNLSGKFIKTSSEFTYPGFDLPDGDAFNYSLKQQILNDFRSYEQQNIYFGNSLSIAKDGNVLAIGGNSLSSGITWIYRYNNGAWKLSQKIIKSGITNSNNFNILAIDGGGTYIAIGVPPDNVGNSGYFNIYEAPFGAGFGTLADAKFNSVYSANGSGWLDMTMAFSDIDNVFVLGLPRYDISGLNRDFGAIRIYQKNDIYSPWSFKQQITGSISGGRFGESVSLNYSGNIISVGSPGNNLYGKNAGAAYIYTGNKTKNYELKNVLYGDITGIVSNTFDTNQDYFGSTSWIDENGEIIVIGAPGDYRISGDAKRGALFFFTGNAQDGWTFYDKVTSLDDGDFNLGSGFIVGTADKETIVAGSSGYAMFFSGDGTQWYYLQKMKLNDVFVNEYDPDITYKFFGSDLSKMFAYNFYKNNYTGAGHVGFFELIV